MNQGVLCSFQAPGGDSEPSFDPALSDLENDAALHITSEVLKKIIKSAGDTYHSQLNHV